MSVKWDKKRKQWFWRKWITDWSGKKERVCKYQDDQEQSFLTKKAAEDHEAEYKTKAKRRPSDAAAVIPTFDEWFNGVFWADYVTGGMKRISASERESKRFIYDKYLKKYIGKLPLDHIDEGLLATIRRDLRRTDDSGKRLLADKTVNNILTVISTPLNFAVQRRVLMHAPLVGAMKLEKPEPSCVEFEEYAAIVASAKNDTPECFLAVLLAGEAGLRIGEIRALRTTDVDLKAGVLTVAQQVRRSMKLDSEGNKVTKDGKTVYEEAFGPPKGKKRRRIKMTPLLVAAMRDHLRDRTTMIIGGGRTSRGYVIQGFKPTSPEGPDGRFAGTQEMKSAFDRVWKRTGLPKMKQEWHLLRHTFATHIAMLGGDFFTLNEWMGHSTPSQTMEYISFAKHHERVIPDEILQAGENEADPVNKVLAKLAARASLPCTLVEPVRARRGRPPIAK